MLTPTDWTDYELLDAGNGEKLERWGRYTLRRPDPQAIWPILGPRQGWDAADAHYQRSSTGGGRWEYRRRLPERWSIQYNKLQFHIEPTGFKHTGLFPEQAVNWNWFSERIRTAERKISVLNLFAYTGGATVAAAAAGASVVHVDAARRMVARAKENLALSGYGSAAARFITDDVFKFVEREERRNNRYDAVIMDPPTYGRGPNGELWKLEETLPDLIQACAAILSDRPLFFLINAYTTGFSPTVSANLLKLMVGAQHGGNVSSGEIGLPISAVPGFVLPCGNYARWEPA